METPFTYGKLAVENNFTDRQDELKQLVRNFGAGANTILISPRRWGKSSLVLKAASDFRASHKSVRIVMIDLFNVRNEEDFYKQLMEKTIQSVSGKMEEVIDNIKSFLRQWVPQVSFSPDSQQEFSLSLNWQELKKQPDEALELAENIAAAKGLKIIVCIDEFQNIAYFDDPLAMQKKLRSHWQRHQGVTYCLYGSKRHMMMEVFASPSMPFYKFGDLMFLLKIPGKYWIEFIVQRFQETGKNISASQAEKIAQHSENHPYYVQQLAQLVWLRSSKTTKDNDIVQAYESLIYQLSMLFYNLTETLSNTQLEFLHAILDGVKSFSSKHAIEEYHLGTSANVSRIKKALTTKEIIDEHLGEVVILDPMYAAWLKNHYFI